MPGAAEPKIRANEANILPQAMLRRGLQSPAQVHHLEIKAVGPKQLAQKSCSQIKKTLLVEIVPPGQ